MSKSMEDAVRKDGIPEPSLGADRIHGCPCGEKVNGNDFD
jgi:hypothetical protein